MSASQDHAPNTSAATEKEPPPPGGAFVAGFDLAAADWNAEVAGRPMNLDDWSRMTLGDQRDYYLRSPLLTFTVSIARNGDVTNDTQTHGSSFAEVYLAFHAIKAEVERQIAERRACPFNPKYGATVAPEEASPRQVAPPIREAK